MSPLEAFQLQGERGGMRGAMHRSGRGWLQCRWSLMRWLNFCTVWPTYPLPFLNLTKYNMPMRFAIAGKSPRAFTSRFFLLSRRRSSRRCAHATLANPSTHLCTLPILTPAWRLSQIKVRDFSRATVSITPAEFASWADARAELLTEAKRPLKAQLEAEMATAANDAETRKIRAAFDQREKAIEVCMHSSKRPCPRRPFQATDIRCFCCTCDATVCQRTARDRSQAA